MEQTRGNVGRTKGNTRQTGGNIRRTGEIWDGTGVGKLKVGLG